MEPLQVLVPVPAFCWSCYYATYAQITGGENLEIVGDPGGDIISDAEVTATPTGTGVTNKVSADPAGFYKFHLSPAGSYVLTVWLKGLNMPIPASLSWIREQSLQSILHRCRMTGLVNMIAETPLLNTTALDFGGVIQSEKVTALPSNGRNFAQLLQLEPGYARNSVAIEVHVSATTSSGAARFSH